MRVAIVGSRDYPHLEEVKQYVYELPRDTVIVSGGARGVDNTAVSWARAWHMRYEVYPADWAKDGRGAGLKRNRTIVDCVDEVAAFWDGESRGTKFTINYARQVGKPVNIYYPHGNISTTL